MNLMVSFFILYFFIVLVMRLRNLCDLPCYYFLVVMPPLELFVL